MCVRQTRGAGETACCARAGVVAQGSGRRVGSCGAETACCESGCGGAGGGAAGRQLGGGRRVLLRPIRAERASLVLRAERAPLDSRHQGDDLVHDSAEPSRAEPSPTRAPSRPRARSRSTFRPRRPRAQSRISHAVHRVRSGGVAPERSGTDIGGREPEQQAGQKHFESRRYLCRTAPVSLGLSSFFGSTSNDPTHGLAHALRLAARLLAAEQACSSLTRSHLSPVGVLCCCLFSWHLGVLGGDS